MCLVDGLDQELVEADILSNLLNAAGQFSPIGRGSIDGIFQCGIQQIAGVIQATQVFVEATFTAERALQYNLHGADSFFKCWVISLNIKFETAVFVDPMRQCVVVAGII